jgi:malonate-semialdehyde dehydrogenase (acetylating) / methylmalonate-semialdehyde dehydrogenase
LVERAKGLKVNGGFEKGTDMCEFLPLMHTCSKHTHSIPLHSGPLISPAAKARVTDLISSVDSEGGTIHLDGRNFSQSADSPYRDGNFVGPTIVEATTTMRAYQEEIFGPVLVVMTSPTLDDALEIVNANKYGNGTAIFTQSGATARKFESEVNVGQVSQKYE